MTICLYASRLAYTQQVAAEAWPLCRWLLCPRRIAERLRREAEKLGASPEETIVEALSEGLDPQDRARDYIEAALELLRQTRGGLERGEVRQAAGLVVRRLAGLTASRLERRISTSNLRRE